jgi:hypothetical protein
MRPRVPCAAGVALNVLFLSWLYAYYCFDYKWALQGIRLPVRLQFFEANWAFFAGWCAVWLPAGTPRRWRATPEKRATRPRSHACATAPHPLPLQASASRA